jgi:hypothetical protein
MARLPLARRIAAAAAALAAAGIVAGLFLSLYTSHHYAFPVGYDTPKYIWRANLVEAHGPQALANSAQPPLHVNADRPGYPLLVALLHATTGVKPFGLTFVLPAVVAVAIALAAGAFAIRVLHEPTWAFAVYAVAVGVSVNVALIAIGYADTLLASAALLAAATTAVAAAGGERTYWATVVLVAGAVVVHWNFAVFFLLILFGLAVLLVPESIAMRRDGTALFATPTGRLGVSIGGSALAGLAALLLGPAAPKGPSLGAPEFTDKIHRDVPQYRFWATGPASAIGAGALWRGGDRVRRRGLGLAVVWGLSGGAAVAALAVGLAVPAHRILAFAFGIPILVAAGIVGAGTWVARRVPPAGALLVLAALAGTAFLGYRVWSPTIPWLKAEPYTEAQAAGSYLARIGGDHPVIFVIDEPARATGAVNLPFRVIRSGLPGGLVKRTFVYIGNVDELLAGRKTRIRGDPKFNLVSRHFFAGVRPELSRDPIVLAIRAYDRHFPRPGPGVDLPTANLYVARGPAPANPVLQPAPPSPHSNAWLAAVTAATLAVLFLTGLGWSIALVPGSALVRASLAPAFGIAVLTLAALVAGRANVGLNTGSGVAVALAAAAIGWAAAAVPSIRAGSAAPSGSPSPPA